ncbi:MAG: hypothetical protein EBZ77_03160 [Chitinophagia bacterium]|nr:hypothetical protein [Chitinophagia bacterium]
MTINRLLLLLLCSWPAFASAQLYNCNGFIANNYLEAGMNWNGAFGSSTTPPPGFHPERKVGQYNRASCGGSFNDSALAFVADIDKDGWYSGAPTRFGDYLLPGIAMEGWSYLADGVQSDAWNTTPTGVDSMPGFDNGYFMSYTDTLGVKTLKYQAIKNNVYITQILTLEPGDLFLKDEVIIENTNLFPINNIYFMRLFNAHPDQSLSGNRESKTKIEFTLPDTLNRTIISSRGTVNPRAYMAIATQDPRAIGFISTLSPRPTTTMDNISSLTEPGFLYHQNDSFIGNSTAGILFDVGTLASVGAAHFTLLYAFSPTVFDSTLTTIDTESAVHDLARPGMAVYPLPLQEQLVISALQQGDEVVLSDMAGRWLTDELRQTDETHFAVSPDLPAGTYTLIVYNREGWVVRRQQVNKM